MWVNLNDLKTLYKTPIFHTLNELRNYHRYNNKSSNT